MSFSTTTTGFDAVDGNYKKIDIRGRDGELLRDHWADGPTSYLGLGWLNRIRTFQSVLNRAATAETELQAVRKEVQRLRLEIAETRREALKEGRAQVVSSVLAVGPSSLVVVAAVDYEGSAALLLRKEGEYPVIGARYLVKSINSRAVKGIVEVCDEDADRGVRIAKCIRPTVPGFWEALAARVDIDESAPADVEISPYRWAQDEPELDEPAGVPDTDTTSPTTLAAGPNASVATNETDQSEETGG